MSLAVQIPYESFLQGSPTLRGDHREEAHRESFQTKEDLPIRLLFLLRFLDIFFNCLHFRAGPPGGIMAYMIK